MENPMHPTVERNITAHRSFFGEARNWSDDVGSIINRSPWTPYNWAAKDDEPRDEHLQLLEQMSGAWEKKRPFRQWPEQDAERLADLKRSAIKFVEVLGSPNPGEECAACLRLKGKKIFMVKPPRLPLPACDLPICKCILLASE